MSLVADALEPVSILDTAGTIRPGAEDPGLAEELLLSMYRGMIRIRVLDERMQDHRSPLSADRAEIFGETN